MRRGTGDSSVIVIESEREISDAGISKPHDFTVAIVWILGTTRCKRQGELASGLAIKRSRPNSTDVVVVNAGPHPLRKRHDRNR